MSTGQEWVFAEPSEGHPGFSHRDEEGAFWCLRCHGNAPEGVIAAIADHASATVLEAVVKALRAVWHAEEPEGYFEGPESDYDGYALRSRKAWLEAREALALPSVVAIQEETD